MRIKDRLKMVWLERKDSSGAGWKAISVDGYMPERKRLEKICKELHTLHHRDSSWHKWLRLYSKDQLFTEAAKESRIEYWRKIKGRSDFPHVCPCDIYLMRMERGTPILPPFTLFYEESIHDQDRDNYGQFLVFQKGCEHMEPCTNHILETLDWRIKPRKDYKGYEKFVKECEDLMEVIFEVYIAPCITIEEKLRNLGFGCFS